MPPSRAGPMKPWSQQVSNETRLLLSLSLSPHPFSPPNPLLLSSYLRRTCSNLQRIIGATGTARPQRYLKLGGSSLLGESIPFTPSSPAATVPVRMRLSPRHRAPRCPPRPPPCFLFLCQVIPLLPVSSLAVPRRGSAMPIAPVSSIFSTSWATSRCKLRVLSSAVSEPSTRPFSRN